MAKNKKRNNKKSSSGTPAINPKIMIGVAGAVALVGIIGIIVSSIPSKSTSTSPTAASTEAVVSEAEVTESIVSDAAAAESTVSDAAASEAAATDSTAAETAASEAAETTATAASSKSELATSAADINITHTAAIDIKDYGTITVALDETAAPETVKNFVSLAESGFYDGLTFHRIIDGFMMQGGDPLGNGTGGSDKTIKGEFKENGFENNLSHTKGAISMARSQAMDSASSQFFIVQADSTFLDGSYAAFGYVTDGIEIVDKICKDAEPTDSNGTIEKDKQPVINSIKVTAAGESGVESVQ